MENLGKFFKRRGSSGVKKIHYVNLMGGYYFLRIRTFLLFGCALIFRFKIYSICAVLSVLYNIITMYSYKFSLKLFFNRYIVIYKISQYIQKYKEVQIKKNLIVQHFIQVKKFSNQENLFPLVWAQVKEDLLS